MAPAKDKAPEALSSAWERDKAYGLRLDKVFPATPERASDSFLILGAKSDGMIDTELGEAEHVSMLVQRLDEKGRPTGIPMKVGTLARAIVDKLNAAQPDDFPAIVQCQIVEGRYDRAKGKGPATLVLQHVGETDPSSLLDEFGVTGEVIAKANAAGTSSISGNALPAGY